MKYPHLGAPIRTGRLELSNRTVLAALSNNYGGPDGFASEQHIAYYRVRGAGGWGGVTTEGVATSRIGRGFPGQLDAWDDRFIPGLRQVAEAIKAGGARAVMQVMHCGRQTAAGIAGGTPVAPSPIMNPRYGEVPRALTPAEIATEVDNFAQAVRRARDAGFDGAELHGAHGYLIGNFLSPISNRRTDGYGGDLAGRTRFLLEIIRRCREVTGDFALWLRISADEYAGGGVTVEEACEIARLAESAGVDAIHASAGVVGFGYHPSPPAGTGYLSYIHLAAALKRAVQVPVIAVGRIMTPEQAEAVLASGQADLVALGRASIADPDWVQKALAGENERIIPCVGCNVCTGRSRRPETYCLTNPKTGREAQWEVRPLERVRRLAVIGSGAGGLAAACAAAERGMAVTLYDPEPCFGGLMGLRARTPLQVELQRVLMYWRRELARLDVEVKVGLPDGGPASLAGSTDAVVVAVGQAPAVAPAGPEAADRAAVLRIAAPEILAGATLPARVVIQGAGLMAAETACYLASAGAEVTVVEPGGKIAPDAAPAFRSLLAEEFAKLGVRLVADVPAEASDVWVIPSGGGVDQGLVDALQGTGLEVLALGDAYDPLGASELVWQGAQFASVI